MKVEKVRIGFVGVGGMGQCAHLRNFVTVPDCEVVALAEIKQEQGKLVATRYGIPKAYASHQEMLANEQLDAIVAPQQFSRHGVLISELAAFGLPIMTEKPLAGTIAAGEKILKALAAGKTWQMVGYHKRSDPAVMYAKAEIDRLKKTGELGKLKYVRIIMPAGDWVANGLIGHLATDEPVPNLEWDAPAADMD
ncbi:MAG: Gfo/Idh/MocA family oxidoreductase [Armatimonadota bacterium]